MIKYTKTELAEILAEHVKWLEGTGGNRADLKDADLKDADLKDADLKDANLRGADLRGADLRGADLKDADLENADLKGADLRGAKGLPSVIVPDIDRAVLSAVTATGCSLNMKDWHTCATTHCRAGWAITLAGSEGLALEKRFGSQVAGTFIYAASRPGVRVPDFFASTENAMQSIREDAAKAEGTS